MTKPERPPINVGYLTSQGPPTVCIPAEGIIALVSGDGYETVDMTLEQAEEIACKLQGLVDDIEEGAISWT